MQRIFAITMMMLGVSQQADAGFTVGHGGDVVYCEDVDTPPDHPLYVGHYSLDYLLTIADTAPADVGSWEESTQRISRLLAEKHPHLGTLLTSFLEDFENFSDRTRPRQWRRALYGLVQVDDEELIRLLPSNCVKFRPDGKIDLIQAMIRERRDPDDTIIYYAYMPMFEQLKSERPLQFSYLMMHEWAWDFTDDVHANRDFVALLHDAASFDLSPAEFQEAVARIGIQLDYVPDPFDRAVLRIAADGAQLALDQFRIEVQIDGRYGAIAPDIERLYRELERFESFVDDVNFRYSHLRAAFHLVEEIYGTLRQSFHVVHGQALSEDVEDRWIALRNSMGTLRTNL